MKKNLLIILLDTLLISTLIVIMVYLLLLLGEKALSNSKISESYEQVCAKLYGELPASDYHIVCGSKGE